MVERRPARMRGWLAGIGIAILAGCTQPHTISGPIGDIVGEGVIACPPPTERCELSGATVVDGRLLLVNDRAVAGKVSDSVLATTPEGLGRLVAASFLPGMPPLPAEKLEAISTAPGGRHVFAITAFDRHDPATTAQDRFNVLLTWPAAAPRAARVLGAAADRPGTSLGLRRQLRAALATASEPAGPAYFKVEGLAVLPDQLLIGLRETGVSHRDFRFTLTLLSVPWMLSPAGPVLSGVPRVVWRLDPATLRGLPKAPVGLSDIVYDAARDRLWLLTSYEREDDSPDAVAGYLWRLDRGALASGAPPVLVRNRDGRPLMFDHKPEALAILPDGRLLVVHDDDRRATPVPDQAPGGRRLRRQGEAFYQILRVVEPP